MEISLLGCSPLPVTGVEKELTENLGLACDGDAVPHNVVKFNLETMLNFIKNLLEQYGQPVSS